MRALALILLLPAFGFAQDSAKLQDLFREYYEDRLRESPELATFRGRTEYNDRWTDWSAAARERRAKKRREYLERLRPFLNEKLSEQDELSARVLDYLLRRESDTEPVSVYLSRVSPYGGIHTTVFQTIDLMPRNTVRDYENLLARLRAVPVYVDQNIELLNEGIARGLTQPKPVLDRVVAQVHTQAGQDARATDLLAAFRAFPSQVPESDRTRLSVAAARAYDEAVLPAWKKLAGFLENTYARKARPSIALTSVPGGSELYRAQVRAMTTTSLLPEQIHEIGKREVARLEADMLAIARESGFQGSLQEYEKNLEASPAQHFRSKDEMLAYCRNIAKIVEPELPKLFRHIPRLLYGIRPIPAATEAATASNAQAPAPDGSRPGWFNLNAYQPEKQLKYTKPALVLHEAVPGHIFQLTVALELSNIPEFRKSTPLSAYIEGWGLYAESLGSELGAYPDAASRIGQLESERFRAVRLVVDTGMHALGWSRDQAIEYLNAHAPDTNIAEIDRYIAWPGQALAYKMGQLKIMELRRKAEAALGPKFDIREFHDAVLRNGALPLELLERTVDGHIREKQAGTGSH